MTDSEKRGISRRDLIKRGAIVGGAAMWTTPAVQMLRMTGARATDGPSSTTVPTVPRDCICDVPSGACRTKEGKKYYRIVLAWSCEGDNAGKTFVLEGTSNDGDAIVTNTVLGGVTLFPPLADGKDRKLHLSCSDKFGYDPKNPGQGEGYSAKGKAELVPQPSDCVKVIDFYIAEYNDSSGCYDKNVCCLEVTVDPNCGSKPPRDCGPCFELPAGVTIPTTQGGDRYYLFLLENGDIVSGTGSTNNIDSGYPGWSMPVHISCSDSFTNGYSSKGTSNSPVPGSNEPRVSKFFIAKWDSGLGQYCLSDAKCCGDTGVPIRPN